MWVTLTSDCMTFPKITQIVCLHNGHIWQAMNKYKNTLKITKMVNKTR